MSYSARSVEGCNAKERKKPNPLQGSADGKGTATSGKVYHIQRRREYNGEREFDAMRRGQLLPKVGKNCDKWAVVTTIFEPSKAAMQLANLKGWCLCIVGDKKGPMEYEVGGDGESVVFLSASKQEDLPYHMGKLLPWNHFGRKNLGYIYAVHHGAKIIYDFDDDNFFTDEAASKNFPLPTKAGVVYPSLEAYNPYPYYTGRYDLTYDITLSTINLTVLI